MAATREDIEEWLKNGIEQKCSHVIVVCDTFDYDDYPVYVSKTEDVKEKVKQYDGKQMQKIMEVYNLSLDLDEQLNTPRNYKI